jgi:hypothetical protein
MRKSINQIRTELSEIQQAHAQVNSFFWGDFLRAYKENTELNYPLMGAFYPTAGFLNNQTTLQLTVFVCDKMYKDWSNLNDVESDTLQICRDIFQTINSSTRWQRIGRVQSCSVTKFIERGGDEVAGHTMTFQILLRDNSGVCGLPMFDYDFDQVTGVGCAPVQIYKNGILIDTIEAGGIYEYNTDAYTYSITNSIGGVLYSGTLNDNFTQSITDSIVENSDASYSESVLAQGSLQLPDTAVFVNDSEVGSVVSVKDLSIEINSIPTSVDVLDNLVSIVLPPPASRSTATLMKTGQTTSYRTGDDGDIEAGRNVDFFTLAENNPFGNTNRFTDVLGGQTYANSIVIDWSTYNGTNVLCYYIGDSNYRNWNAQIDQYLSSTIGGLFKWKLLNYYEMVNIQNEQAASGGSFSFIGYPPFNAFARYVWVSNQNAFGHRVADNSGGAPWVSVSPTNTYNAIWTRYSTVTGTTLS